MVSLFLAWHDQYFIMFKDSNAFKFTNFPFKTKYNNTVVYSVNSNCLLLRKKQEKKCWNLIKSTIYLLIFWQNSMIFGGNPNSLKELFHQRMKTGGVLIHRWIRTRGVLIHRYTGLQNAFRQLFLICKFHRSCFPIKGTCSWL